MSKRIQTVTVGKDERVELPANLSATDVEVASTNTLTVVVDETAETTEYIRRFKRSSGPRHANMEIPTDAIVIQLTSSDVTFLEPVE